MLEDAAAKGMLAASALIAHGRGEAFDYLLGEMTTATALEATTEAAARLSAGGRVVISINGNVAALAADDLIRCSALLDCPLEINIFYRTPERMSALLEHMSERQAVVAETPPPHGWRDDDEQTWAETVRGVRILGAEPDASIPGLEGPRAKCHREGILDSDVILVPLEDGDRCEALVAMGKDVLVVDLNPLSRSAKMGNVTIVDELTRFCANLLATLITGAPAVNREWDNLANLQSSLDEICRNISRADSSPES
jgi:4-phosphopantoate--beta-alanine ligase